MHKQYKILIIVNSFYSAIVSINFIWKIISKNNEKITRVDLVVLESCSSYVIDFLINSIQSLFKIQCKLLSSIKEIKLTSGTRFGFKFTRIPEERLVRKKFLAENYKIFANQEYKYIISGSVYYIGFLEKIFSRKKIYLTDHGISDLVSRHKGVKYFIQKIFSEVEHFLLYFSCNINFLIKRISLNDPQFLGVLENLGKSFDSIKIKNLNKREKDHIILILPVVTNINKDEIIEKFYNTLLSRNLKNKIIICKAHPSLHNNGFKDTVNIFVDGIKKFKNLSNEYLILEHKIPIEFALSARTTHVIGELSTVLITAKLLCPSIKIIEIDFISILQNHLNYILNHNLSNNFNIKWLSYNLTEQLQIKKLYQLL